MTDASPSCSRRPVATQLTFRPSRTVGFLVGGGLHQLLGMDLLTGILAQSVLTALGLATLVYSLYVRESDEMLPAPA